MQALETLLSSQLAAWHNRHPLARHVRAQDVHTMGVIALPFMRSGPPREPQEPTLDEPGAATSTPSFTRSPRPGLMQRLLAWRPGRKSPQERWPVFSEQFIVGVSAAQAGDFARRHGYSQRPDDGSWPLRSIPVDESLAAQGPVDGGGAWPEEIYLLSAAIDAGPGRTRVLVAQGAGLRLYIRGPRCLHPLKVGAFGLLMALLLGLALLAAMAPRKDAERPAPSPSSGASAPTPASALPSDAARAATMGASAVSSAASAALPAEAASMGTATMPPGQASSDAASAGMPATPGDGATPAALATRPLMSASQLPDNMASAPDIRPQLVRRPDGSPASGPRPALGTARQQAQEPAQEASKPARPTDQLIERANSAGPSTRTPAVVRPALKIERPPLRGAEPARGRGAEAANEPVSAGETLKRSTDLPRDTTARAAGAEAAPLVALVGPAMASRSEAEAYLKKMQPLILPLVGSKALEQQVLETPEGWRAAVWPFASREEAQLINAMLIARGLRTRAVDF